MLVFDLQGLGMAHLACRSLLRLFGTLSSLDAAHFPDTVGTIVCLDAPRVFAALWAAVSRLVATGTRNKLLVYANTARAEALGALRELTREQMARGATAKAAQLKAEYREMLTTSRPQTASAEAAAAAAQPP